MFDLNVWSYLAVTQAFLPLLLKPKGIIVNHTSLTSVITLLFQATCNTSKAAMVMYSDTLRLELASFGVRVVDLKIGLAKTNMGGGNMCVLPKVSLYEVAKETGERAMSGVDFMKDAVQKEEWASDVVGDLLKRTTPKMVWTGGNAYFVSWLVLPSWVTGGMVMRR